MSLDQDAERNETETNVFDCLKDQPAVSRTAGLEQAINYSNDDNIGEKLVDIIGNEKFVRTPRVLCEEVGCQEEKSEPYEDVVGPFHKGRSLAECGVEVNADVECGVGGRRLTIVVTTNRGWRFGNVLQWRTRNPTAHPFEVR